MTIFCNTWRPSKVNEKIFVFNLSMVDLVAGVDTGKLSEYSEMLLYKNHAMLDVLRLLCLQSVVNNGFRQKTLESIYNLFLQVHLHMSFYLI